MRSAIAFSLSAIFAGACRCSNDPGMLGPAIDAGVEDEDDEAGDQLVAIDAYDNRIFTIDPDGGAPWQELITDGELPPPNIIDAAMFAHTGEVVLWRRRTERGAPWIELESLATDGFYADIVWDDDRLVLVGRAQNDPFGANIRGTHSFDLTERYALELAFDPPRWRVLDPIVGPLLELPVAAYLEEVDVTDLFGTPSCS